jgi:hypothetical protein
VAGWLAGGSSRMDFRGLVLVEQVVSHIVNRYYGSRIIIRICCLSAC